MATQFDSNWRLTNATGIAGPNNVKGNIGVLHPKLKFNFTIQFVPRGYLNLSSQSQGNELMEEMEFAAKTASRPKPTINYQDVNFYNFRTKVATSINYGEVSVSFYDDPNNWAHDIVTQYLQTVSPLYGKEAPQADNLDALGLSSSAGIGPLNGNRHGPMKSIIVTQYYSKGEAGVKNTKYEYLNPKLISVDFDDLDMSVSEFNLVTINFTFDTFKATNS